MDTPSATTKSTWQYLLSFPWEGVSINYHGIALKGGNRKIYAQALKPNLSRVLSGYNVVVHVHTDRLEIRPEHTSLSPEWTNTISNTPAQAFGVVFTSPVQQMLAQLK